MASRPAAAIPGNVQQISTSRRRSRRRTVNRAAGVTQRQQPLTAVGLYSLQSLESHATEIYMQGLITQTEWQQIATIMKRRMGLSATGTASSQHTVVSGQFPQTA